MYSRLYRLVFIVSIVCWGLCHEMMTAEGCLPSSWIRNPTNHDNTAMGQCMPSNYKKLREHDIRHRITAMLTTMTLRQKVGQVFILAFRKTHNNQPLRVINTTVQRHIEQYHPGGIVLFGENIDTIDQTVTLITDLQASSVLPLFIAVDEEGGRVSRLNASGKMHATKLPGNGVLGRTGDTELSYKTGRFIGQQLMSLGFNMNFAPVADLNSSSGNSFIGDRSFGDDPDNVGRMVATMVKGMQQQNISSVLKHFPGHGDTSADTHKGTVTFEHHYERLRSRELIPFISGIGAEADGIMTAHIRLPSVTNGDVPATLSEEILTDILRDEIGYDGLILTDALEMVAITKYWSPEEAAVMAFQAGADILLLPPSYERAYNALLNAITDGRITEKRLDESIRRILRVKILRDIISNPGKQNGKRSAASPDEVLGSKQGKDLVDSIVHYSERITEH